MLSDDEDEPDMIMRSRSRGELISADTAVDLARRVHSDYYGVEDLNANEPLTVSEKGNFWIVRGSKKMIPFEAGRVPAGPFVMKISKFDARILSYVEEMKPIRPR